MSVIVQHRHSRNGQLPIHHAAQAKRATPRRRYCLVCESVPDFQDSLQGLLAYHPGLLLMPHPSSPKHTTTRTHTHTHTHTTHTHTLSLSHAHTISHTCPPKLLTQDAILSADGQSICQRWNYVHPERERWRCRSVGHCRAQSKVCVPPHLARTAPPPPPPHTHATSSPHLASHPTVTSLLIPP